MKLYHYTSIWHLSRIQRDRFLKPSESNIGSPCSDMQPCGSRLGPDVVWLTDDPDPTGHGLGGSVLNKRQVRITVNVPDAIPWREFAFKHGINPEWFEHLNETGGGKAHRWFVVPRPIHFNEWTGWEVSP